MDILKLKNIVTVTIHLIQCAPVDLMTIHISDLVIHMIHDLVI